MHPGHLLTGALASGKTTRLLAQLGPARLEAFNSTVGKRIVGRLLAEDAVLRFGRALPFGLGAGIGAAGNVMVTRLVGRAAAQLFTDERPRARRQDADVLDLDGEEVDPASAW